MRPAVVGLARGVLGDGTIGDRLRGTGGGGSQPVSARFGVQGRRSSIAARMPVAKTRAVPMGRARIASAGRIRSCRMLTEVDFPDSEVEVEVVSTSWSPISRESLSAKSGSSMPDPMTLTVAADHIASMPASPQTFWPCR